MIDRFSLVSFSTLLVCVLFCFSANALEIEPPQLRGAIDVVTDFGIENPPADSGRLRIRSFELGAKSVVDSIWSANLSVAGHDESGTFNLELDEAYLNSNELIANTELKAGRFYLGVGLLNRLHTYDWGFTSAPKSQTMFFAKDPIADTGLEVTHHFGGTTPVDLTAGITNGWSYTHTSTSGRRPLMATHYVHPSATFTVGENKTFAVGLNYLGRTDADSIQTRLAGFDLSYKSMRAQTVQTVIQSEFYHRIQSSSTLPLAEDVGGYVFTEAVLGESAWSVGGRLDAFTTLSLHNSSGDKRQNFSYGATPLIAYRASPSSTFRASYSYLMETREGDNRAEQRIEIQLIALIGEALEVARPTASTN